ncbi:hypothetical protein VTO73DRAFT_9093 [Trametes versicolor]
MHVRHLHVDLTIYKPMEWTSYLQWPPSLATRSTPTKHFSSSPPQPARMESPDPIHGHSPFPIYLSTLHTEPSNISGASESEIESQADRAADTDRSAGSRTIRVLKIIGWACCFGPCLCFYPGITAPYIGAALLPGNSPLQRALPKSILAQAAPYGCFIVGVPLGLAGYVLYSRYLDRAGPGWTERNGNRKWLWISIGVMAGTTIGAFLSTVIGIAVLRRQPSPEHSGTIGDDLVVCLVGESMWALFTSSIVLVVFLGGLRTRARRLNDATA